MKWWVNENSGIICLLMEKSCPDVRPKAHSISTVATVSSWAVTEIKQLLFVLSTVIIGCVGERKDLYLTLNPYTYNKGAGGIFST